MRKKKFVYVKRMMALMLCMVTTMLAPLSSLPAFAANRSILEVATVPQAGEKADREYEFIAKYIEGATTVSTFGDGWYETADLNDSSLLSYSIVPTAAQKGKIGVIYSNVGVYDGKEIDLKITVEDWDQYTKSQGNITYTRYDIRHEEQGYNWVDQTWAFVESGTDNSIEVSGYMTIADIDVAQYIQFSRETSQLMDTIYVAATNNIVRFEDVSGEYKFYDDILINYWPDDLRTMFTFCYKNQSSLRFKWGADFKLRGSNQSDVPNTKVSNGEGMLYMAKKPLASATAEPTKLVSDLNETLVEENKIDSRDELLTYSVFHTVPDEWEDFYYNSYVFEDKVEDCFDVRGVKVYDLADVDVTNGFDVTVTENKITASAKNLDDADFYFQTYRFDIDVKIKDGADLTTYMDKAGDNFIFKNKASVTVDKDKAESNEVNTKFEIRNPESQIRKYIINSDGNYVLTQNVVHNDTITFFGEVRITNAKIFSNIAITDQLHHSLSFKDMTVYDAEGNDITEHGTISVDNNLLTFAFNDDYVLKLQGESLTFLIDTEVSEEADFSGIENGVVINTYNLILDNETKESNEVKILVPTQENSIEKSALDVDGSKVKSVSMEDNKQDIVFIGGIQITNTETIKNIELEDILHPAFAYKDMNVFDAAGNDITDQGEKVIEGQKVRFVFHDEFAKTLVGKEITWKITVNYIEGSDLSGLKDNAIPNTMTLYVNGKGTDSNEVDVTPIPLRNEIKKAILDSNKNEHQEVRLNDNSQDITFRGSIQVSNMAVVNNIVLEDTLHAAFKYKSMNIYDSEGSSIKDNGTFREDGKTIRFTFDKDYAKTLIGKTITWEITVNYIEGSDLSGLADFKIPNVMTLYVNGDAIDSNTVKVEPITLVDNIVKYVVDAEGNLVSNIELAKNSQDIVFEGQMQVNNTSVINNAVIEDKLHKAFTYKNLVVYDAEGNNITSKGDIKVDGQNIQFVFNKDYTQKLNGQEIRIRLTVTYNEAADLSGLTDLKIPNVMTLYVNGEETVSPPVTVVPIPIPDSINKYIIDENEVEVNNIELTDNNQEIVFSGRIKIKNTSTITKVILTDELNKALSYVDSKVYNAAGIDITQFGTIHHDPATNILRFEFDDTYVHNLIGKELQWVVTTTYIEGSDLSALEGNKITNTMKLTVNEDETISPPVVITPIPLEDEIIKSIEGKDGSEITSLVLEDNSQDIIFIAHIQINNTLSINSVILEDVLHNALSYKDMSVFDADGNDITDKGEKVVEGQNIRFVFNEEAAKTLVGKEITWKINANYIEGSDLSGLKDLAIPNVMSLLVNDKQTDSNKVTITPIPLTNSITKSIVDADGNLVTSIKLDKNTQVVTFRGIAVVENDTALNSLVIKDEVSPLFLVEPTSVVVTNQEGEDITDMGNVKLDTDNVLTFTVDDETKVQELSGETLTLEFDVMYDPELDFTEDQSAENVMQLITNDKESDSNVVEITPVVEAKEVVTAKSQPKTGLQDNILLYGFLALLFIVAGGGLLFIYRKKNRKANKGKL